MPDQDPTPSVLKGLAGLNEDEYGANYRSHVLDIYKLYVEMADRISKRRQAANSFFLALNSAMIAAAEYVRLGDKTLSTAAFYSAIGFAGTILCYQWYRLIRSYKDLNSGKFKVVQAIEAQLPLKAYYAEWDALGRDERADLYLPFTKIELRVPWVFMAIHILVILNSIPLNMLVGTASC